MTTEKDADISVDGANEDVEQKPQLGQSLAEVEEAMQVPRPGGHFFDQFDPAPVTLTTGPDGLPVEVDPPWKPEDAAPIPLTPKTMSCLAQERSAWCPSGLPKCRHYKRQRVHSAQTPDRPLIMRFCCCDELRGLNGAALVVDDSGIFNCEFRDPPDPRCEVVLDKIDAKIIEKGEERLKIEAQTGHVHGYRLFPTLEDVKQGRYTVDEGDFVKHDNLGKDE